MGCYRVLDNGWKPLKPESSLGTDWWHWGSCNASRVPCVPLGRGFVSPLLSYFWSCVFHLGVGSRGPASGWLVVKKTRIRGATPRMSSLAMRDESLSNRPKSMSACWLTCWSSSRDADGRETTGLGWGVVSYWAALLWRFTETSLINLLSFVS